jgi:dipeptidyl aminopeptidase/acylaminoacyl peptidase
MFVSPPRELSVRSATSIRRATIVACIVSILPIAAATAQNASPVTQSGSARHDPITKRVLTAEDYSRWRSIEGERISSDGQWVAWAYRFTNVLPADSKPELHILHLATKQEIVVANGSNPVFSPDGKWIAYQVDSQPPRTGRGGRGFGAAAQPGGSPPGAQTPSGRGGPADAEPLRRTELRELATGKTQSWRNMQSVIFAANSKFVLLRRRAATGAGRGGRGGAPAGAAPGFGRGGASEPITEGSDAVLHDLTTGRSQFIGSVGDAAFNRSGDLLAYVVDASMRDGNGLFVTDLATGSSRALDNDARIYDRLAWNENGTGIAVLKGKEVEKMRERDNVLVVIPDVRAAVANPEAAPAMLTASTAQFPKDWVISDRAPLSWSEDGARVFFGVISQTPAADTTRRRSTDSIADVDVWRTDDRYIQSVQMIRADQDRNFTYREAFDVAANKYVALTDSTMRDIQISTDGRWGVGRDTRPYISDYKPAAADFFRVNTATGERTPILKGQYTQGAVFGISPDSHKFIYWANVKFHAYDLDAGTSVTLGADAPSFVNTEFDHPGPKPPYGVAGFTSDGKNVIVEGKYDLWLLPLDGAGASAARNLTMGSGGGAKSRTIFRIARVTPIDSSAPRRARTGQEVDLSKPVTLSAFGELTKKDGFYRLENGKLTEIVYEDADFSTPVRAANADQYLFTRQTFVEFPDLRVSGADFRSGEKISDANPQQAEYKWGHRVLFDFTDRDGHKLQGMMALPDDYKPGERRPMIVNFYEKNTQNLNRYSPPSFLTGMGSSPIEGVSRGYIMMIPDVYYHTGSSHTDQLDAVESATRKVIAMGYADPKHIGLNGHSYGGEGAAFIATKSRLFAAVGVGAGVTDLFTDFSQEWGWSYQVGGGSGANGNEYYLYGQGRWGVSPWDKPELYHNESALTHVPEVTEPILIMHGTADPTVSFIEGLNFYNALRFNGKNAILLAYPGEGHGLRGLANRKDLTIRYFQFFDHYLKDAPAPKWMTDGVPFLRKDELKDPGPDVP